MEDQIREPSAGQGKIIQIDEEQVKRRLDNLVRGTVEETINELLEAEADALLGANRYERTESRKGHRSGSYSRRLHVNRHRY
jgi:transposase-like protein